MDMIRSTSREAEGIKGYGSRQESEYKMIIWYCAVVAMIEGPVKIWNQPHEPGRSDTTRKPPCGTAVRGEDPSRRSMPVPSHARP